jgi:hypothetical protein
VNKEILESLTMLEDKLNLKNVKNDLFLTEAKNKPNDMDGDQLDYNEKKLYQKRADYDKKVKEFNDQSMEVERLKQVSQVNKDPAIEQNYERKKTALKTLKAEKSQAYWDKVNAGRDLKNIKYESYEFDQLDESRLPSDPDRDPEFGVPEQKKYPLFDRKHVISAIKLFGHVEPKYESHLAHAIIKRMKKYNISFDIVGEDNKLYKYLPKTALNESKKFNINDYNTEEEIKDAIKMYSDRLENVLKHENDYPSVVLEGLENIIKQLKEKLANKNISIKESLEYDNKMKIAQAVEFIKNTRQGRITADGSVTNEEDPEGVTQSAEEFANSKIGTEIEHALYFNSQLGDGWFIMLGVTGTEEPHIAYFYKEGDIFRVVDPVLGEMYDKRFSGNVSPLFKSFDSVVREYKKFTEDTYQVFSNIDFLVGQPISMFQELITKNWKNGELDTPEPVFEKETETVQEAMNPAQPTTSTKETVQNSNMQAREKAFDNQIETKENQIDNARENINSMKQTNANLRDNMQAATDEAGKNNLKAAIQAQTNRITRANVQVDRLEKQKRDLEKQKSNTLQQYEQRAKLAADANNKQIQESAKIIHEALSICDLAFSGEVGKIAEYLITGQSTGNQEVDYIATKIKDSAVIKNIIFKYDRELQKINPDRTVISNLKLKLKSEINKIKKNY